MVILDSDAKKLASKEVPAQEPMFEELPDGGKDARDMLAGTDQGGEGEQTPPVTTEETPAVAPEGEAPIVPEGETPTEVVEESPAVVPEEEAPVVPEGEMPAEEAAEEVAPEGEVTDEAKAIELISAQLGLKSETLTKAGENLQQAAEGGDKEETRKKLAEFELAQKDMEYQMSLLQEQLANERENSKKYLDDKRQAELDSREKSKVYDTIMDNEGLKNVVLYKQYAENNEEYTDKYKDVLRAFFEKEYGVSLESLLSQSKVAEKSAMGTGGDIFGGQPKSGELIGGMFEEL